MRRSLRVLLINLVLVITGATFAWAQGTVNSRTQAGDGTAITNTTAGRLDVTTQAAIQANAGTNLNTSALLLDATFTGRLPAAFSSADNIAAQTATAIHGLMLGWDGAGGNWDRLRVDASGNLNVNLNANAFGTLTVTANAGTNLNTSALLLDATYTGRTPAGASPADNESNTNTALSRVGTFNFIFDGAAWDRWTGAVTANAGTNLNTSALALDATLTNRFPAGSTPADNESNSITATRLGVLNYVFDGSTWDRWTGAVTQSGTWNITNVSGTVSLPTGASTLAEQQTQTTSLQVIDNIVSGSGANISQFGGSNVVTGTGTGGAGIPRVTVSSDSSVSVSACTGCGLTVTDGATFTAGVSAFTPSGGEYNPSATPLQPGQQGTQAFTSFRSVLTTPSNSYGVELGTVQNPIIVAMAPRQLGTVPTGLPPAPSPSRLIDAFGNPIGTVGDRIKVDPTPSQDACAVNKKKDVAVSQTATTRIVTGNPALSIYVCMVRLVAGAAEIVSLWEGTGTNCGTGTIAHSGSATVANGESLAANGGFVAGTGAASVVSLSPGNDFCVAQNGSNRVSGQVSYVYAP